MKERLETLYEEIESILNIAPSEENCSEDENIMYSEMENLKEALYNAGYYKKDE